jgi:hypothetical protein
VNKATSDGLTEADGSLVATTGTMKLGEYLYISFIGSLNSGAGGLFLRFEIEEPKTIKFTNFSTSGLLIQLHKVIETVLTLVNDVNLYDSFELEAGTYIFKICEKDIGIIILITINISE